MGDTSYLFLGLIVGLLLGVAQYEKQLAYKCATTGNASAFFYDIECGVVKPINDSEDTQ